MTKLEKLIQELEARCSSKYDLVDADYSHQMNVIDKQLLELILYNHSLIDTIQTFWRRTY